MFNLSGTQNSSEPNERARSTEAPRFEATITFADGRTVVTQVYCLDIFALSSTADHRNEENWRQFRPESGFYPLITRASEPASGGDAVCTVCTSQCAGFLQSDRHYRLHVGGKQARAMQTDFFFTVIDTVDEAMAAVRKKARPNINIQLALVS